MNSISETLVRFGLCEVCRTAEAKYCCPRCEVKSCSLNCCKIHKSELNCSGVRHRAKFIGVNNFTNIDLSRDYRMLEDGIRLVTSGGKRLPLRQNRANQRFDSLKIEAANRKVTLKFLPAIFQRHKTNISRYDRTTKLIEWDIDLVFVNAENFKCSERQVPETKRIGSFLSRYLGERDPEIGDHLAYYQAVGLAGVKILLKAEGKQNKFYEVDPTMTVAEVLRNKEVVEYPVFHVVLKDHCGRYDILDSDDEEDKSSNPSKRSKSGQEVVRNIVKKSEIQDQSSAKNLLFETEFSDDSDS